MYNFDLKHKKYILDICYLEAFKTLRHKIDSNLVDSVRKVAILYALILFGNRGLIPHFLNASITFIIIIFGKKMPVKSKCSLTPIFIRVLRHWLILDHCSPNLGQF
jgi:hypothetical protein